jgi:hypothetical protein
MAPHQAAAPEKKKGTLSSFYDFLTAVKLSVPASPARPSGPGAQPPRIVSTAPNTPQRVSGPARASMAPSSAQRPRLSAPPLTQQRNAAQQQQQQTPTINNTPQRSSFMQRQTSSMQRSSSMDPRVQAAAVTPLRNPDFNAAQHTDRNVVDATPHRLSADV